MLQSVEAVWVWKFNASAYRATYGRFTGGQYTKDYLQVGGGCGELIGRKFGVERQEGSRRDITYVWPGGEAPGFIAFSKDRFHAAWPYGVAPLPWKVAPEPSEESVETIPGDPTFQTEADAETEWGSLETQNLNPYLVAVKLRGEVNRLHIRAYLGNAPGELGWASLDQAPDAVRECAATTNSHKGCASLDVTGGVTAEPGVAALLDRLEDNPNVLLVGPPGTGKTVLLEQLVHFVEHNSGGLLFDPDINYRAFTEGTGGFRGKTRVVVLHPAYTYDSLVVGLLPEPAKDGIAVKPAPGPLVNLARFASKSGNKALLVLDEFNRGNSAAVLGDTLALLDKDKRDRSFVNLPYSELGIEVPVEFADGADRKVPERFTLPPTLWIVAAMNSSDRSVAPLDAALRRRFSIIEMPPNYPVLAQHLGADEDADLSANSAEWAPGHVAALAVELLRSLNARLDAVLGTDFRIGQSNFWTVAGNTVEAATASLAAAFDFRVVATLRLAMQDDDGALAAVLRAGTAQTPLGGQDSVAYWKGADTELGTYASPRLHLRELSALGHELALAELRRQAAL